MEMMGKKKEEIDEEIRVVAKAINFGLTFGLSDFSLSQELGCSLEQAQAYIRQFFSRMPRVQLWINKQHMLAETRGYVVNLFGRKRRFKNFQLLDQQQRKEVFRQAQNAPIQGGWSDIASLATIRLSNEYWKQGFDANLILTIHDAVYYEVREDQWKEAAKLMQRELCKKVFYKDVDVMKGIPLTVDMKVGKRWGELKKIKEVDTELWVELQKIGASETAGEKMGSVRTAIEDEGFQKGFLSEVSNGLRTKSNTVDSGV
jgi:DNA polymerase-1